MAGIFESQKREELFVKTLSFVIVSVGGVVFLLPFLWMLSSSLKTSDTVAAYPPSFLPTNVRTDRINQDYTAIPAETAESHRMIRQAAGTVTIAGRLTGPDGEALSRVRVSAEGGPSVETDPDGRYRLELPAGYSGTVTAQVPGIETDTSVPVRKRQYVGLTEDRSDEDFDWSEKRPTIAGRVRTEDGRGLPGVHLIVDDGPCGDVTDASGYYRISVPYDWGGTIKPVKENYRFEPERRGYSLQWVNYIKAMKQMKVITHGDWWTPIKNTLTIVVLNIIGQIIASSLVGYGFARLRFRGSDVLFIIMLSTMMLPGQVTMIPIFILFRELHWVDTFKPLVVPAFCGNPFFIFLFRQYFLTISVELEEAARIDGCGFLGTYLRIILPLSKPLLATVAIFTFMGTWNDFMGPLIYLSSPEKWTLALALDSFKGQYGALHIEQLMACSVVMMLPCLVLFFFCQKYFIRSVVLTGVKG